MKEFIVTNMNMIIYTIIFLLVLAIAAAVAIRMGYKKRVAEIAYHFVIEAESKITGTKKGQERKAQVITWLHEFIPPPLRFFISEEDIDDVIEIAVQKMKEALQEASQRNF